MEKMVRISMLILVSFMVFSCLDVDEEYDFDGNDFAWDVSVSFAHYDWQPLVRDSVMLWFETDSIVGSSSLRIIYDIEYDKNEILIELTDIGFPGPIVHQDFAKTTTLIGLDLNEDYNIYKIVVFNGDNINTGKLSFNALTNRFYLKPSDEMNVTFIRSDIIAVR